MRARTRRCRHILLSSNTKRRTVDATFQALSAPDQRITRRRACRRAGRGNRHAHHPGRSARGPAQRAANTGALRLSQRARCTHCAGSLCAAHNSGGIMTTSIAPYAGEQPLTFNPNEHLIQIPNKGGKADYLPVQWRLVWFRELCPTGTIDTEEIIVDLDRECEAEVYVWNQDTRRSEKTLKIAKGYARFRAVVTDGKGGRATATKTERAVDFPDYVEKAETGAIGRALAMLGYGTQFIGDELNEDDRLADEPVEKRQPSEQEREKYQQRKPFVEGSIADNPKPETQPTVKNTLDNSPALPQQLSEIDRLVSALGKPPIVKPATYKDANVLLTQLSREYNKAPSSKDTAAITRGELFECGEQKGMWTRMSPSAFYAMASAITGRPQSKQDWTMTADEMAEMARQIDAEQAAATSGK